ncbi:hypothetical protein J7426_21030 [Tropicibacter sp. R16_0]|uniref:tetratricopeptide repeat protein n=1 Tax=Tropicibacter sp. R16_0 TaxID=2821102 RepID=UPI001ADCA1A8|nr:hypothetical protein [Tropicibacter sp. R16_0]MBO9452765.1 hypothetical protein [Tropicibacter sp. R16_0]
MTKGTPITYERLLEDESLFRKVYDAYPEVMEAISGVVQGLLNSKKYEDADNIIGAMQNIDPNHPKVLYFYGLRQLESKNIPEAKVALSRLLEMIRDGKPMRLQPQIGCVSLLAMGISMYMFPAKESGDHEEAHDLFQEIYLEYSDARGVLTQDQRDLDQIARCLERIDSVLSQSEIKPAFAETLMVDLRKLLQEKTKGTQPLLSKRCGLNILFPSIVGHNPGADLPEGIKLDISISMGFESLTARPDTLYSIQDWLEQPIVFVGKRQTIGEVIKTLANADGAHAASQDRIEREHGEGKSGNLKLLVNDDIKHDITYRICAFVITWLAEYPELTEAFPILNKYRGRYEFNYRKAGFVPNWVDWDGKGFVRIKLGV